MNGTQDQQSTLGKLRSTYINAGLLSESTDLAQFSSAPESVRQTLLEQGRAKGLISEATTDEVFMSAWGDTEQKKKDDTESVSEDGSLEPPVVEGFDNQAERARGLRSTARLNEDGTESTVLMASMEVDGKNVAIPTLFPKDPNNVTSNPEDWMELDAMEAYDTALERGEVFEFETADDANAFAEGSWKVDTPVDAQQPIPRTESDEFFDMALEGVTPEVIGRTDDDDTVMEMNNLFGQYGFSFETANVLGDAMTVTAKNGETLRVDLDPWRSKTEVAEAEKLNNFLKQNRKESENLLKQEDDYQAAKLKFANEKQIDQRVNQLSSEMDGFQQFSRELGEVEAAFNEKYAGLDKYTEEYLRANPDEIEAYNAQAEAYNADLQGIQELRGQLQHRSQELLYANQEINRAAAEFVEVQGGISTWPGLVKTALSRGTAITARGLANFALDVTAPAILIDMRSDEDYPSRFIQAYKDIGGTQDVSEEDFEEWYDGLPDDLRHDVDMKVFDDTRKFQKYGNDEEKGLGDAVYDGIMWATGEDQKIPYAYELAQQNWWGGSILGAIESIPAFVGLGKKLFTTGFKAASRVARMFGQVTDHVDQEFRDNPELRDVTEQDKLLLKVPLGATVAVLENIGFRNVMANKGFASYFLMKVLGKSSLGVGKRSFRETVALEVNNAMARGLLTLGNAGAAEFETGMAQEIADIAAKEVWNAVSDNPDLDTPELNEMLGQVVNAGAQEAVGSFVLGTPAAVSAAFQKADYASLSDEQVAILEFLSDPGNRGATKPMIAAHLKNLVNQGKLTGKQAKEALDGYESTVQALDGIRDVEGMSSEQKKKALALEVRKQELERRMNSTAKPFQRALQSKIDDLVIQQEEIADAIQEQSTEEVPTRDETEAGPEVGGQVQEDEKKGLVGRMRDRLQRRRVRKSKEEYDKAMARVAELEEQGATEQEIEDARNKAARDRNNYLRTILTEEQAKQEVELDNERERLFKEYEAAQGTEQEAEAEAAWRESADKQTAFFNSVEAGLTEEVAAEEEVTEEVAAEEEVAPTEDEVAVEEEAAELAAAFEAEGTPDRTETTDAGVDVQRQEGSDLTKKQQRVVDQANNVLTSLKSLIPDIKVIAHQTQLQYEAATGLRGRGTYVSDGKTIHINLSRANSRTAFHEAFHAIFLEQIKNGDPDAQAKAKVLLTTISKALPPKSVLKNRIDSFLTQYDQQDISEEALAEVFSYIASGYRGLGPQVKAKIKAAIKNLIESVLGRKLGASWSEGDQAVLDAMEILAGKVERGEAITSEDVSGIEVTEEAAAEVKAETEVDAAIGRIQELRRKAVGQANDLFGDLFVLLEESGKGDGSLFSVAMRRLFKDVGDSKLRAIEKKIRDVKKAKKLSDTDKAERVAKLEREAEKEVTRLEQAREQAKPGIKEAMAKLEPFAEKKRKKAGLAEIKKKQAAITKRLAKDKKEAKKVFEGAELKEYLAELQEEAEAKRAALRQEIAELRGKKKTEAPVEEEAAPVEEVLEETVEETEPTVEEQPTVATIRTKVGVEAFGKLEAAVRSYLEYINALDFEDMTRGQKSASTRRVNKVVKLATELGLTDAEQAVMQNSVLEKIEAEKRSAEAKETEQAELKAAAERAKKAAEAPVEETVEAEPAVEEELMPELTKRQLAKLLKERPNLRVRYYMKDGGQYIRYTIGYSRSDGKYFFSDGGRVMRDSEYNVFSKALERFLYQHNKAKGGVVGAGFIGLYDDNISFGKPLAKFDFEMNNITEAEPTVEEETTVEEVTPEPAVEEAPVDDVAKRAAVEGVSVEELTKQEAAKEMQRRDALSRDAKRELDGLKGKTDKASKAKRAELKEFMANLGTMSVEEALAKRDKPAPKAKEVEVDTFLYVSGRHPDGRVGLGVVNVDESKLSPEQQRFVDDIDAERNSKDELRITTKKIRDNLYGVFIQSEAEFKELKRGAEGQLKNGRGGRMAVTFLVRDNPSPETLAALDEKANGLFEQALEKINNQQFVEELDIPVRGKVEVKPTPKAREQRVSDVVERYEFRPNGSLKNASLAAELRRNLKRYGFGVKQFGTRMDDVHIVNPATGRKVDPKKLIAKDRAEEKVEREEMAAVEQEVAEKRALEAEAEDLRSEGLKRYQEEYLDFPEGMIPPSTLSAREQRDSLNNEISDEDSTYSAVKFAKERGYSNAAILKFRPGAQQAIDAYEAKENRLKEQVKGVIVKATERIRADKDIQGLPTVKQRDAAALARLENDVIRYLQKSKFYQNASDVGREAMVRGVKKQLGINMKSAPSANRLLNGPLDKNGFSEQEKKGLRDQIRAMARSSKTTATAIAEARKQIAKDVAKLRKDGVLTTAQATALLNRMARTNPLNEASVNSFIEYANKVFMDADYAKKMNDLNKMRARALKYAEEKTGINVDVIDVIRTIAGINAEAIPEEVLKEYTEVMTQLSERKAVLDLENRVSLRNKLETIIDAIDQEINAKDELLAEFENFDAKVPAKEKVSIAKTIKAMIEAGVITQDEAKLLRKYQGELFPEPEGKDDAELQQERENEARFLRGVVEGLPELTHKFPTREENILLRQFNELIKTSGIEGLDNAELKNLLRVANNIENGFLPHMAEVLVEKIDAENKRAEVMKSVVNDKSGLARLIDRTGLTSLNRRGRKNPTRYIDQVWGDFKSTRLFDAVFKDLAVASSSYRADLQVVEARMDKVQDALIKALGRNPNKVTRAKFLLGAYLMQKEFEANPNVKGVFSAIDLLDATIKQSQKVSTSTRYNDASVEVLKSIRDQIELRTADEIEAIIKKEQGGKQMLAVADEIRKINDELTPKAQYVAGVIRGVPFMPYSQYMHRVVLKGENEYGEDSDKPLSDVMNKNMMPSTRAKNLIKREAGEVPPVNFDPFASVNRGAKFVLTDYYMTKPVRTNKRLVNKLGESKDLNARQREMVQLLMNASETLVKDMLVQAVNQDSLGSKVFNYIKRKGYQVTLGQVERAVAELGSNASYALWVDPGSFRVGQTYRNIYNNDGTDILRNVGSMQTTRLFPGGEGTRFESSGLDQMRAATSPGRAEIRNEAANKGRQIINQSFGRLERGSGAIADYLITKPDQMISRPLWFGSFAREFEARTGQKPDMKKIAENNGEYMDRYSQAIESATAKADDTSIKAGATDNLFLGMLNGTIRPDQNGAQNLWTFINSYMTRFLIFEYVTARTAVQAMVGNGMMRKRDGVRLMAGVTSRMFAYQFISGALRDTMGALLYGDDEEEKDLAERASESVVQGMATLVLGNTMGQLGRGAIAIPVELLNRDMLAEGEYGFGKRVMMPLIDINPEKQFSDRVLDGAARSFGPASAAVRATLLGGELAFEEIGMKKKRTDRARAEQEQMRFAIKALGAAGVLPFANDINYHYQRSIYKDIDKKKSKVIRLR